MPLLTRTAFWLWLAPIVTAVLTVERYRNGANLNVGGKGGGEPAFGGLYAATPFFVLMLVVLLCAAWTVGNDAAVIVRSMLVLATAATVLAGAGAVVVLDRPLWPWLVALAALVPAWLTFLVWRPRPEPAAA